MVRGRTPNFTRIATKGYHGLCRGALPAFTNVNNASICTGLPPSKTGICGNYFLDPETGEEVMTNSPKYLQAPTLLLAAAQAGRKVAFVTAKDKLRAFLSEGLIGVPGQVGIAFSAERAATTTMEAHGIVGVEEMVGEPAPSIYSAQASVYALKAGAALVVLWALNGYCQSLGFAPGSRLISNWWPRRERGKAFGFYIFAAGCSTILTFLLSIILLENGPDWRWLMRLPVLLLLVAAIAFFFIVREKPEDLGFAPLEEGQPQSTNSAESGRLGHRYRHVFRNGRFLVACLAIGFQSVARYGLLVWTPVHYLGKSWKKDDGTAWIALALPVGMALGALFFGQLSDRVFRSNRSRPIALSMTLAGIVAASMWFMPDASPGLSLVLMFLAGFFVYGPASSFWAMCPDLLGRSFAGTGVGVMNSFAYLMAGMAEPIIGAMIDVTGDTAAVFGLTAIVSWACAVIVLFVRR